MTQTGEETLHTRFGSDHRPLGDQGIQIFELNGRRSTVLKHGAAISTILDSFRTGAQLDDVVRRVAPLGIEEALARDIVRFLIDSNFLVRGRSGTDHDPILQVVEQSHPRSRDPSFDAAARLSGLSFGLVGSGLLADIAHDVLRTLGAKIDRVGLGQLGAWTTDGDPSRRMVAAFADTEEFESFRAINQAIIDGECQGYFAWLSGAQMAMGPFVVARQRPCFACFADRYESNIMFIREFREKTARLDAGTSRSPLADSSLIRQGLGYHLALDLLWHVAGRSDRERVNKVRYLDLANGTIEDAPLLRAPRCGACGAAGADQPQWAVRDLL